MKSNYLYLLFICVISCLFVSCSDEDNKGEDIPEWNRFRTTNVLVYAHLSEQNLFSSCSYKEVASSIRNTTHSVALLDRTVLVLVVKECAETHAQYAGYFDERSQ